MAGFGGMPKLSSQQQEDAFSALMPLLLVGSQTLDQGRQCGEEQATDIVGLMVQLAQCVSEIQALLMDIEEGHSRLSTLDPDELEFMIVVLTAEVKTLSSRIRASLAMSRIRGR